MVNLLIAGKLHPSGEALIDRLRAEGHRVDYVTEVSEASYAPKIADADALVIRTQPLSAATIAKAERLKIVSRHGVGYDAVDLAALNARGIALAITADANATSVAEHAMMLLLAAAKRVILADDAVRAPNLWGWRNQLAAREVSGRNLLILGYGRTGRGLAQMASGFGMRIRAHDPYLSRTGWPEGPVAEAADLGEALAWADFISVHVPKADRPTIGAAEIARMRPGVVIANTARGGVIDEAAMIAGLRSGQIGAAGVDVFDSEPPKPGDPLLSLRNVILSPHIAGLTEECSERMALSSIENAFTYLAGTIAPRMIVNREHVNV